MCADRAGERIGFKHHRESMAGSIPVAHITFFKLKNKNKFFVFIVFIKVIIKNKTIKTGDKIEIKPNTKHFLLLINNSII